MIKKKKPLTELYPKAWAAVQALRRARQPALADELHGLINATMRFYRLGKVSEKEVRKFLSDIANRKYNATIDLPGETLPSSIK